MMHYVSKKYIIAAILVLVVSLFCIAPSGLARYHYTVHRRHYVYHHHSKLKGALVGAAGGALIGGLAGHGKGALIGAGAGAGTGYLVQRYRNHRERRRIARYR